jgi:branched-chain amino acid transport system substrate-binding protein
MIRMLMASAAGALIATAAAAQEPVNVGVILGFTGPLESITPGMAAAAELAFKEASDTSLLPGGAAINPVRADSTCIDAAAATTAAERLVTSDNVAAIMGSDCSGVTTAIANNVAIPNGVVMISPSATSPALSDIDDNGYFFRTAPSDARQGVVLTQILKDRGVTEVAITYTNNDYGKGFSDALVQNFTAEGGTVLINQPHEDGKGDYSAEVAALSASGAEHLVVLGYVDQGGRGIIQAALDTGAFESFFVGDGMHGQSLIDSIGSELDGKLVGSLPQVDNDGSRRWAEIAAAANLDPTGAFAPQSYDAGALIALAMAAAGSADPTAIKDQVLNVANAPGEVILPGELAKGLQIIADGGDVDYMGATAVELIGPGESAGSYLEYEIQDGAYKSIGFR